MVTGAGGFIGRHLCKQLGQHGYEVIALLRQHPLPGSATGAAEFDFHLSDIRDTQQLAKGLDGVELVFHLAGIAHVEGPGKSVLQSANRDGTASLIEAAQIAGVRKIIYFSSSLAGAAESGAEDSTAYGESKYQAEQLLMRARESTDLEVCILRPVNVYGPGMKGHLVTMIKWIRKGLLPPLPTLPARFSLIEVTDLCQAAILSAENNSTYPKTYYVTDGVDYNINEIETAIYTALGKVKPRWRCPRVILYAAAVGAEILGRVTGRQSGLGRRTYRNLVSGRTFSNSPICDELGFKPSTTFYNELASIVADLDNAQPTTPE